MDGDICNFFKDKCGNLLISIRYPPKRRAGCSGGLSYILMFNV